MSKLIPNLLSLAFLLVLTTACNRDAVDSTQNGSGTFLAPASAPMDANARAAEDAAKPQMTPMRDAPDVLPGENEPTAGQMTSEELEAARRAGPGRVTTQPQAAAPRAVAPATPKTMSAPTTGGKPVIDYDRPVMTVSKTACYGDCRQFALTLTNDRRLILDAGKNMDRKGKYTRMLSAREYNELLVAMQAANPEGLAPLYPNNIKHIPADAQGTVLKFPDPDGKDRKVEVYYNAPGKLTEFLTTFESWVDKDGWIRTAE